MEYIAYTLIAIALLLHGYDSVRDRVSREIRHMVTLRQYTTLLFLAGTVTYGFIDGHGLILLTFIVLTALSSMMFGMNMAIYVEEKWARNFKELREEKRILMSFIQIILHIALGITALTIVFMVFMFLRILFLDGMSNGFINLGYAAIAVFICWGVGALISKFI